MSSKCIGGFATAIVLFATLFFSASCNCPSSAPCAKPNPLVSRENSGFSVTADSLPGTAIVTIVSTDAQGNVLDSLNVQPKEKKKYQYGPSAARPIQLRFYYKSANGEILGGDQLRVDDLETNNGGVIAMDVVMGFAAPNTTPALSNAPQCPTVSTNATAGVGSLTVSCASSDWFQVKITHNNVEQRIGLFVTADNPSKLVFFRNNVYTCLTNPTSAVNEEDGKSVDLEVSSSSNLATIGGSINNGQKSILIDGPAGCTISVNKK